MCLDTTNFYKKFLKEEWREDQQEEGKNTVAWRFSGWEGLCFSEEGGWGQINVENKRVEMVIKDLLLADNQKKKKKKSKTGWKTLTNLCRCMSESYGQNKWYVTNENVRVYG